MYVLKCVCVCCTSMQRSAKSTSCLCVCVCCISFDICGIVHVSNAVVRVCRPLVLTHDCYGVAFFARKRGNGKCSTTHTYMHSYIHDRLYFLRVQAREQKMRCNTHTHTYAYAYTCMRTYMTTGNVLYACTHGDGKCSLRTHTYML